MLLQEFCKYEYKYMRWPADIRFYDGAPRNHGSTEHDRLQLGVHAIASIQDVFRRFDIDKIHFQKQEVLAIVLEGTKPTPNDVRRCLR